MRAITDHATDHVTDHVKKHVNLNQHPPHQTSNYSIISNSSIHLIINKIGMSIGSFLSGWQHLVARESELSIKIHQSSY
jgi:hypothetical protein